MDELPTFETIKPPGPLDWKERFKVSRTEIEQIADPDFIIRGLVVAGLSHAYCAEPNAGKTTLFMHFAAQMADRYSVVYVNADIAAAHAKEAWHQAEEGGFDLLLPDMAGEGLSMGDVVKNLEATAAKNVDLSGQVWIFDTLKKMTDVIQKAAAKRLYATLRKLTANGMTVIALAHTNKYLSADGKPIYEGTSDLRSDFDNLVYLLPKKNPDGSLTVSTEPDKQRAALERLTFEISADRIVSAAEYVDVASSIVEEFQLEKDSPDIEAITEALQTGLAKQIEVISFCKERYSIPRNRVRTVLKRYSGELWDAEKQFAAKNAWRYTLR